MREPRRDHYLAPATGTDTEDVLDAALDALATLRGLHDGDASVTLHLLASLLAEARSRLPEAVADARDQQCSWAQIADLVGVTRASAWQRYSGATATAHPSLDRHRPSESTGGVARYDQPMLDAPLVCRRRPRAPPHDASRHHQQR